MSFAVEPGLRELRVHEKAAMEPSELLAICRAAPSGEVIYAGRNTIWALEWGGKPIAVKAFGIPWGIRQWVYGCLRASKAKRSFENASALISLGLHTPSPVGYMEFGSQARLLKSFYVSEYLPISPETFPLRDVLLDANRAGREAILMAFGRFSCRLHDLDVLHRDYSPGNILVASSAVEQPTTRDDKPISDPAPGTGSSPSSPAYRFELVDLNRMSFGALSPQQRMHNLRLLWADDVDLRTVVRGYAEVFGKPANTLLQPALRASQMHKARASREEHLKKTLRAWVGKSSPTGGAT
jgi:hypothetical protein